jgi:hypothetical protein
LSFVRLKQMASSNQFYLVLTDVSKYIRARLARNGIDERESMLRIFSTLDYGMEWCESKLLLEEGGSTIIRAGTLRAQLKKLLPSADHVAKFIGYLERQEVEQHHILINQGDPPDCMFHRSGRDNTSSNVPGQFHPTPRASRVAPWLGDGAVSEPILHSHSCGFKPSVLYRLLFSHTTG